MDIDSVSLNDKMSDFLNTHFYFCVLQTLNNKAELVRERKKRNLRKNYC